MSVQMSVESHLLQRLWTQETHASVKAPVFLVNLVVFVCGHTAGRTALSILLQTKQGRRLSSARCSLPYFLFHSF